MKSIIFTALLHFCILSSTYSQEYKIDHTGLISEMVYYNESAKEHAIRIFNDKVLSDEAKSIMLTKYNNLKLVNDQIMMQLISDLLKKKRSGYFKHLDKYYKEGKKENNKKVIAFNRNWNVYVKTHEEMMSWPPKAYRDSLVAEYKELEKEKLQIQENTEQGGNIKINPADPLATVGSLFGIYKNIQAANAETATNIVALLYTLRLPEAATLISDEKELLETKIEGKEE